MKAGGWLVYSIVLGLAALNGFGVLPDKAFYVFVGLILAFALSANISEWEQRSRETADKVTQLSGEMEQIERDIGKLAEAVSRMAAQMGRWQ